MSIVDDIIDSLDGDEAVKEVRIGPFWTAVWSRCCGLASTAFVHEHEDRFPVKEAGFLTGKSARSLCRYATSESLLEATLGVAAINSLIDVDMERCQEINAGELLLEKGAGKRVAIVGHFPFVPRLRRVAKELWVLEKRPRNGDLPAEEAERVIPLADVVAITGTALINGTMEGLLRLCRRDSLVMVLGPSTPLTPVWFEYGVDLVSGARVTEPEVVLKFISEGAIFKQLRGRGVRLLTMAKNKP
ncbi:MAG: Rossmann-like domain-containing protein [Thermacetogeniaceae bacterium]